MRSARGLDFPHPSLKPQRLKRLNPRRLPRRHHPIDSTNHYSQKKRRNNNPHRRPHIKSWVREVNAVCDYRRSTNPNSATSDREPKNRQEKSLQDIEPTLSRNTAVQISISWVHSTTASQIKFIASLPPPNLQTIAILIYTKSHAALDSPDLQNENKKCWKLKNYLKRHDTSAAHYFD